MSVYSLYVNTMEFDLKLVRGKDWPKWSFAQPYTIISKIENHDVQHIKVKVDIGPNSNKITLNNFGKTIDDTVIEQDKIIKDQTIEIQKIWANNVLLELITLQKNFKFYPTYRLSDQQYADQNKIILPIYSNETKLFYNGCWEFEFDQPFFHWYNNKLMTELDNINNWVKQSNLGMASDSQLQRLNKLLCELSQ
jgi:hypothetical protein